MSCCCSSSIRGFSRERSYLRCSHYHFISSNPPFTFSRSLGNFFLLAGGHTFASLEGKFMTIMSRLMLAYLACIVRTREREKKPVLWLCWRVLHYFRCSHINFNSLIRATMLIIMVYESENKDIFICTL